MSDPAVVHLVTTVERADPAELAEAGRRAFRAAGLGTRVRGLTAVKSHFGEEGGQGFLPPPVIRAVVDEVRSAGGTPFLTDTTTLYTGKRAQAVDYAALVHAHGFTFEAVGAPFVAADGLVGANETEVRIDGVHHRTVALAADALRAGSAVIVSHVTGHLACGLGATVKNLGMGLASRRGKLRQHSTLRPHVDPDACTACEQCLPNCPTGAIAPAKGRRGTPPPMAIDSARCSGCGECLASCRDDAIRFDWKAESRTLQESMAEHALGYCRRMAGRIGFLTFATHVTKDCDCMGKRQKPLCADIGVLAGTDPVAIDQAALDLVRRHAGRGLEAMSYPRLDGSFQLDHGERIGLGTRSYQLVKAAE
ncbi:MAG: DUF362 domain-containing protein [Deltaproteobacteria bacterium]|nr:DUF362 domain-containing protein [Deltaproteobacteria bacterium]